MSVEVSRKAVLAGAGLGLAAVAVAACSGGSDSGEAASSSPEAASSPGASSQEVPPAGDTLATTAEVPVGSGIIVDEIVLTQPVAGEFKGFSSTCTHTGCQLNEIADGTINCPCHGSKFSLDGEVVNGPATRALDPVAVQVQGDSIVAG